MHDIIGDIVDWDVARKVYLVTEGATGERYNQRIEAAEQMARIEAQWQHLPGGFHAQRKQIKIHIQAVADTAPSMSSVRVKRYDTCVYLEVEDAGGSWEPAPRDERPDGLDIVEALARRYRILRKVPTAGARPVNTEGSGAGSAVMRVLAELDQTQAELQKEFPGWRIWYVYHPDAITWAAQREPVLNTRSAEDLRAAIRKTLARNDSNDLEILEDVRTPLACDSRGHNDTQDTTDMLPVIAGEDIEDD